MNWNPHTLQHCVDSDVLGWLTAILALGMLVWYIAIARRWHESMQQSDAGGRKVWGWLTILFLVCAAAGYVALIIALFFPKTSVIWRLVFLTAQNFVCPIFWTLARKYKFHLYGAYQNIGEQVASMPKTLNNEELGKATKTLVLECLNRQTQSRLAGDWVGGGGLN